MANALKPKTKSQIVAYFADKFALPKKQAAAIFEELACFAAAETKKVGVFNLPGIGKVVKKKRNARIGRNPATGEAIKIPAKTVVKARLSKAFAEAVVPKK